MCESAFATRPLREEDEVLKLTKKRGFLNEGGRRRRRKIPYPITTKTRRKRAECLWFEKKRNSEIYCKPRKTYFREKKLKKVGSTKQRKKGSTRER